MEDDKKGLFGLKTHEELASLESDYMEETERPEPPTTTPAYVTAARAPVHICEVVRKWNVSFDGKSDPIAFLERVAELRAGYAIPANDLLVTIPELLKGSALLWYRNNREFCSSWGDFISEFRGFFLPPDYALRLEEDICRRRQRPGERGRDYVTELQTLIRRQGTMSPAQTLFRLHTNLLPEYRLHIRWQDLRNVSDLIRGIENFETIQADLNASRFRRNPVAAAEVSTAQNRPMPSRESQNRRPITCWRCGKEGHLSLHCREPSRLFCSRCKKEGVLSRDCPCGQPSGNARRTGQ